MSQDIRVFTGKSKEVCTVKDLIHTLPFANYFEIQNYKAEKTPNLELFVLEKSETENNNKKR